MARVVGTHFDQGDKLKTTMNISSNMCLDLARKLAFRVERVKYSIVILVPKLFIIAGSLLLKNTLIFTNISIISLIGDF